MRSYNFASCLTQKKLKPFIYETFDDGSLCDILVTAIGKVDSEITRRLETELNRSYIAHVVILVAPGQ